MTVTALLSGIMCFPIADSRIEQDMSSHPQFR